MAASAIPLLTIGVPAAVALSQFQAVTAGGAIASAAGNAVGFTQTSGNVGDRVPTTALGTAIATAAGPIAVGALLEVTGSAGKLTTKSSGVGVARALQAAAADGDLIEVLPIPN